MQDIHSMYNKRGRFLFKKGIIMAVETVIIIKNNLTRIINQGIISIAIAPRAPFVVINTNIHLLLLLRIKMSGN